MGLCDDKLTCVIVIIVLLLVLCWFFMCGKEHLTNAIYLDQIVFKSPDPLLMKYTGREKDITGMSARDYYYENDIDSRNLVAPQYLEGNSAYVDHTDYLGMPLEYRPSTVSSRSGYVPSAISRKAKSPTVDAPIKAASPTAMQTAVAN